MLSQVKSVSANIAFLIDMIEMLGLVRVVASQCLG